MGGPEDPTNQDPNPRSNDERARDRARGIARDVFKDLASRSLKDPIEQRNAQRAINDAISASAASDFKSPAIDHDPPISDKISDALRSVGIDENFVIIFEEAFSSELDK
jgi:hypothetical protein